MTNRPLRIIFLLLVLFTWAACVFGAPLDPAGTLKILAIGNSFSQDAMEHLYHIAADAGVDVVLGYLYIGGSNLAQHWRNAQYDLPNYQYYKNTDGSWRVQGGRTLLYGLQDEDWDLITLQQVSGLSGIASSYTENGVLDHLIDYVNTHKTNPAAKLGWHMTWAYQSDSTHADFARYGRNQLTMFSGIVHAVREVIVPRDEFAVVIPAGTAIQNVRTSFIGDALTRDGYHLSYGLGRYVAGLTWLHALTGLPLDSLEWVPDEAEIPDHYLPAVKEAVEAAVAQPFVITVSSYVEPPAGMQQAAEEEGAAIDLDNYTLLDWEPVGCAYWQSNGAQHLFNVLNTRENSTASNLCFFVSSGRMFTRDDIPVGSIIEIAPGFQYRPEGWTSLTQRTTNRPAPVTTHRVVVTEEWWGDFQYRAFNVSYIGNSWDIRDEVEEVASKLRIYVPKE